MPRIAPEPDHVLYELGKLIKRQRIARGTHQYDFAALIGVHISTLRLYEHGQRNPPIDTLVRMAHGCDLALSQFLSPLDHIEVPVREPRKNKPKAPK
jgi:transcriptional regulator with XRE-family HTH domain